MPDSQTVSDRILQLSIELDEKSAKAVQKQVAGLRSDLRSMTADTKKLDASTSGLSNSYGKLSAKAVQARNELLRGSRAAADQISVLERLRKAQAQTSGGGGGATGKAGSSAAGRVLSVVGNAANLAGVDTGIARLGGIAQQAAPLLESMGASASQVAVAAPIAGVAIAAMGFAVNQVAKTFEEGKSRVDTAIASQKTYYTLLATGTTESINLGLRELEIKKQVAEQTRRDVQGSIDRLQGSALGGIDKFTEDVGSRIAQAFGQSGQKQGGLISSMFGLTTQAQALDEELTQVNSQTDAYNRALKSNEVALRDAAAAQEKLTNEARDRAKAVQATSRDIEATQNRAAEEEASILQKAADARVAIAKRAAQQEEDAYTNLQRSLADDRIKFGEAQADARLAYQRDEAKSARDHARTMQQIRKDAEADEFELVLNRDFAGLARLRRDTDKKLSEEQHKFQEEREQRLTALKQQLQDNQKAFIREREQRNRQYQQQLEDIRKNKIRELQANDEAARIDLERLHAKLKAELAMKEDAYAIEKQLLTDLVNRAKALAGQATSTTQFNANQPHDSGGVPGHGGFARGGYMRPYQTGEVNERGRESFTTGGRTVWLPNARGYFTPTQGGTVNPAGAGGGINISLQVIGSDYSAIRRKVHADVDAKLTEAFEMLTD